MPIKSGGTSSSAPTASWQALRASGARTAESRSRGLACVTQQFNPASSFRLAVADAAVVLPSFLVESDSRLRQFGLEPGDGGSCDVWAAAEAEFGPIRFGGQSLDAA